MNDTHINIYILIGNTLDIAYSNLIRTNNNYHFSATIEIQI